MSKYNEVFKRTVQEYITPKDIKGIVDVLQEANTHFTRELLTEEPKETTDTKTVKHLGYIPDGLDYVEASQESGVSIEKLEYDNEAQTITTQCTRLQTPEEVQENIKRYTRKNFLIFLGMVMREKGFKQLYSVPHYMWLEVDRLDANAHFTEEEKELLYNYCKFRYEGKRINQK